MAAGDKRQVSTSKPPVNKDTLWLVKSGDRVTGPFNTTEIIRRLRAKELVVIDEVIAPQSRWRHIRDENIFASVVDEIRTGLMSVRDDTDVETEGVPTIITHIDDSTPTQKRSIPMGEMTKGSFDSSYNASRISEADVVSESNDSEHIHHVSAREIEGAEKRSSQKSKSKSGLHSALAYSPPGKNKISRVSRTLWALVAVAVVGGGAAFYFTRVVPAKQAAVRTTEIARVRKEADRAWARAEFLRALKLYGQINREPHSDLETDLRQAILQLRVERESLAAKRALTDLIPRLPTSEAKMRARIALAVADLQGDAPKDAREALEKLVKEPEAGPIAHFNLACAQAATGATTEAVETLKKLVSHPSLGAPSRLLRGILHMKENKPKAASNAMALDDYGVQPAYRQELYALSAASDWADGNKKRASLRLRIALDTDPSQTEEFFFDPLVYTEAVRWSQIIPFIKDFSTHAKSNAVKALYALALIKSDRRVEAQKLLSETLTAKVSDPDLQAVSAYGFMTQGRDDEARGALKFAKLAGSPTPISSILEARLCERASDQNCADLVWSELSKKPNPPVAALVSAARVDSQIATEKGVSGVERLKALYPTSVLVVKLYDSVVTEKTP